MLHFLLVFSLLWLSISAHVSQTEIDAFASFLDSRNPFESKKFKLVPASSTDLGNIGRVKVIATEDIKKDEIVYRFTPAAALTRDNTNTNDYNNMLSLIHAKRQEEKSEWWPYVKILPSTFSTPIFWTPKEFEELKGTSIYDQSARLNATISQTHREILDSGNFSRLFPDETKAVKLSEWKWAYTIFRTRNWNSKITPVMELFNFAFKSSVKLNAKDDGEVQLTAVEDIKSGQQVVINDGLMGNRELLDWYGFVLTRNSHDYYPVGVGLNADEKLYGAKRDLFKQKGISDGQTFQLQLDTIPKDLVFALRIYHTTIYDFSDAESALKDTMISVQCELSVCNTIIEMCQNTLEGLTHTLKSDKALLDSGTLSQNVRSAVLLRRGEKRIILSVLKLAKMQLADVEQLWASRTYDVPNVREPIH